MKYWLLDSSVGVLVALRLDAQLDAWMDEVNADPEQTIIASRLLKTEVTRVLRREQRPISLRDDLLSYVHLIPLTEPVLVQAEAITQHIKTLDAIHLASLIHTGLDATVVTHDATMREVAELIGYRTFDPVAA
ncbi:PIN domain-containing protein [Microbacterium sp.]|uniref:PIN domain-containing protein n=1 Tax=Microbacterium sp. TaxID=51671 RepID=UPI003C775754